MPQELDYWEGAAGDAYIARNPVTTASLSAREDLWREILIHTNPQPRSILEIGAGQGQNLKALRRIGINNLAGVESNDKALAELERGGFSAFPNQAADIAIDNEAFDLVFTSGLLIHIPPKDLLNVVFEAYRLAKRWIVAIEYFSSEERMVPYRGEPDRLWTRDFGQFYMDFFPQLEPIACGFAWKGLTGLDNLTWWVFRKKERLPATHRSSA